MPARRRPCAARWCGHEPESHYAKAVKLGGEKEVRKVVVVRAACTVIWCECEAYLEPEEKDP